MLAVFIGPIGVVAQLAEHFFWIAAAVTIRWVS